MNNKTKNNPFLYLVVLNLFTIVVFIVSAVLPILTVVNKSTLESQEIPGAIVLIFGGWIGFGFIVGSQFAIGYSKTRLAQITGFLGCIALGLNFVFLEVLRSNLAGFDVFYTELVIKEAKGVNNLIFLLIALVWYSCTNLALNIHLISLKNENKEDNPFIYIIGLNLYSFALLFASAILPIFSVVNTSTLESFEILGAITFVFGGWVGFGLIIIFTFAIGYSKTKLAQITGFLGCITLAINLIILEVLRNNIQGFELIYTELFVRKHSNLINLFFFVAALVWFSMINVIYNIHIVSSKKKKTGKFYKGDKVRYCALCGVQISDIARECPNCKTIITVSSSKLDD
ncbi:MAG: hypothetical protein ACFFAS_03885 [Promethearchaeota archaeon]